MEKTLLLVDDNADFLDSTKDVLEGAGYNVITAMSGEEALLVTERRSFDLILMDIKMPGINGVETFIRMKGHNAGSKAILFTAYSMGDLIRKALEEGALEVLSKPIDMAKLIQTIEDATMENSGGSVLLVDDDREFCDSCSDALKQRGYFVTTAYEGQDAIEKLKTKAFDFLLLDMKLSGMTGLDVYREAKKVRPQLSTLIITGYAEKYADLIGQAISESVYTCLKKPLDMKVLIKLFTEVAWNKSRGIHTKPQ